MGDVLESSNYAKAMHESVLSMVRDSENGLLESDFKNLHKILFENIDIREAGVYRKEPVFVWLKSGQRHDFPCFKEVPLLVQGVFKKLGVTPINTHPVDRASKLHFELVNIHPFVDGNGRASRLLMNVALMQHGYPPTYIPMERRDDYIDSLVAGESAFSNFCRSTLLDVVTEYVDNLSIYLSQRKNKTTSGNSFLKMDI